MDVGHGDDRRLIERTSDIGMRGGGLVPRVFGHVMLLAHVKRADDEDAREQAEDHESTAQRQGALGHRARHGDDRKPGNEKNDGLESAGRHGWDSGGAKLEYTCAVAVLSHVVSTDLADFESASRGILPMTREIPPNPTVLVVDDEALIRWAISEGLADAGYPVQVAASGREARAVLAAADGLPLVVLLDLRLPDVADLSLLRHIRAARPEVPVLMMTAHGSSDDAAEALRLGAVRFVGKPFDVAELVHFVAEAWAHRPADRHRPS